jgi:hypothetical protein
MQNVSKQPLTLRLFQFNLISFNEIIDPIASTNKETI